MGRWIPFLVVALDQGMVVTPVMKDRLLAPPLPIKKLPPGTTTISGTGNVGFSPQVIAAASNAAVERFAKCPVAVAKRLIAWIGTVELTKAAICRSHPQSCL